VNPGPAAPPTTAPVRRLLPAMRGLLMAFCVLTALGFGSLFVLSGNTDRTFAWTIAPPLTAAFLGAGYGAGFVLSVLALRDGVWVRARLPVYTVLAFVVLSLIPTLIHLDRFHFAAEFHSLGSLAQGAAWFWLAIYVGLPLLIPPFLVVQERAPGVDPPRRYPVPRGLRVALSVESAVLVVTGVVLYVAPATAASIWPWPLTPLTAQAVAAWLIAFGGTAVVASFGDLERLRSGAAAYTTLGALVLIGVARFPGTVRWNSPTAWVFMATAAAAVVTGVVGWRMAPARAPAERA
jgi:hypothetical protein